MIGLDTNILVRAITRDDATLSPIAITLLSGLSATSPGMINAVVVAELAWTLRSGYGYERLEIVSLIERMLRSQAYVFSDRDALNIATSRCKDEPLHLADALLGEINRLAGCTTTMTFDSQAAKSNAFTLLGTSAEPTPGPS